MLALPGAVSRSVEARCLEWNLELIKGRLLLLPSPTFALLIFE
jgi:hypothetical protein